MGKQAADGEYRTSLERAWDNSYGAVKASDFADAAEREAWRDHEESLACLVAKYEADTWSALVPVTTRYGCVYRAPRKVPSRDGWQLVVGSAGFPDDSEWTWSASELEDIAADAALLN